jgi:hypothetical protein
LISAGKLSHRVKQWALEIGKTGLEDLVGRHFFAEQMQYTSNLHFQRFSPQRSTKTEKRDENKELILALG